MLHVNNKTLFPSDKPRTAGRPAQGFLRMRKSLRLGANIRPIKVYHSLPHLSVFKPEVLENVDFVIYRELTGGQTTNLYKSASKYDQQI